MWLRVGLCLKARADTGRKRAVIIRNLHITVAIESTDCDRSRRTTLGGKRSSTRIQVRSVPLTDVQRENRRGGLPTISKPGLTEIDGEMSMYRIKFTRYTYSSSLDIHTHLAHRETEAYFAYGYAIAT